MEKTVEKRKHKRFKVRSGAYTVLNYDPPIMAQLINMSKDGIAVRYTSEGEQLGASPEIDIFKADVGFYLNKIPVKTISESKISGAFPSTSKTIWQRSLQFGDLTDKQLSQLDHFIQNYTMIMRSDRDRRQLQDPQYSGPERRSGIERRS